jgi:hypothetical protein
MRRLSYMQAMAIAVIIMAIPVAAFTLLDPKLLRLLSDIATPIVAGAFSMRAANSMAMTVRRSQATRSLALIDLRRPGVPPP